MNTPNPQELFKRMSATIDALILCERQEQEAILTRQTAQLPIICLKINSLTADFQRQEAALKGIWPEKSPSPEMEQEAKACVEKLRNLQEISLQNHLLLENSVRFLKDVYQQIFGVSKHTATYNQEGLLPGIIGESGLLLNAQA